MNCVEQLAAAQISISNTIVKMVVLSTVVYSLFNLLCASTPCLKPFKIPEDPLHAQRNLTRRHELYTDESITDPVVYTKYGGVEGYKMASITQKVIYAFEGIPFGENTGGANRFRLAVPKTPWIGLRPAKSPGPLCKQLHLFRLNRIFGSEDCLHINVYSAKLPGNNTNPKLPVIVYIHGGGFSFSTGSEYGPAYLLEEDIVYVNFNYRLAIFGFLSVDDKRVMPDNLAFKDQALALKWIHENIEYFGGDKNRITLSGLSSGATAVHLHYMSNLTRNYFSGGISISGSAFTPGTVMSKKMTRIINKRLAYVSACPNPNENNNSRRFIDCLRKLNSNLLVGLSMDMFEFRLVRFGVVIEDSSIPDAFLVEHPDDVYKNGRIARKPWIATRTRGEGNFLNLNYYYTD